MEKLNWKVSLKNGHEISWFDTKEEAQEFIKSYAEGMGTVYEGNVDNYIIEFVG